MYQKAARLVTEVREELFSVQCNRCARIVEFGEEGPGGCNNSSQEFHDFAVSGSYSSKFPHDMTTLRWVLCADCLKTLVESFVIPPEEAGHFARNAPITATHSETGGKIQIYNGLAYTKDNFLTEAADIYLEEDALEAFEWPVKGVFRHYKGGLYQTLGACLTADTKEPLVMYRELFGKSKNWVRPLSSWMAPVSPTESGDPPIKRFVEVELPRSM